MCDISNNLQAKNAEIELTFNLFYYTLVVQKSFTPQI